MTGVAAIHRTYQLHIHTDAMGGAINLSAVTNQAINVDSDIRTDHNTGSPYARYLTLVGQQLSSPFSTLNVATALNAIGPVGLEVAAETNEGLSLYAAKFTGGSAATAAGSVHRKFNIKKGILVPRTLSVDHQGDATLAFEAIVLTDGSNDPIIVSDNNALQTPTVETGRYAIGPVLLGGQTFEQVRSVEIDFGLTVQREGADSEVWDRFAWISEIKPTITLSGLDATWFSASKVPLLGLAATHANSKIYLRKRAQDAAGFVANGTTEHISITAAGLITAENVFQGGADGPGECSIQIPCAYDGSNTPLVLNTATAIS